MRYPKITTLFRFDRAHPQYGQKNADPVIQVRWDSDAEPAIFCGCSHCTGTCGYPALVIQLSGGGELKARSSVVAVGNVMQPWSIRWTGEKVDVPAEHRADLMRRVWW